MFNYKNYLVLVAIMLLSYSCTDDLDTLPEDDDVAVADNYFQTEEDYFAFLAGIYANLGQPGQNGAFDSNISGIDGGSSTFSRTLWYMQEFPTDEVLWSYENDAGTADLQRGIWTDTNPFVQGIFSRMAQSLAFCNEFVRRANGASGINNIQQYTNEARFLRALANYYFLDLFGKAPNVTEDTPVDPAFRPEQISGQALFDRVESELLDIVNDLPEVDQTTYGRANKSSAQMLLAKLYMNAEVYVGSPKYTEAAEQLIEIINSGKFMLNPVYANNFTADNHMSNEIIFPILNDGTYTQNYGATTVIINGSVPSNATNALTDYGQNGWGGALRLRKQASNILLSAESGVRNTVFTTDRVIDNTIINNTGLGYCIRKFVNVTSTGSGGSNAGGSDFVDTDLPLFRYADVLLMYVECHLRGASNTTAANALTYFNSLRTRASASTLNFATDLNLDMLLDERLRELYWEGHRRQDLIRFGKFTGASYLWEWKGNSFGGSSLSDYRKLYPLPANSLATNPNLTQNTGY